MYIKNEKLFKIIEYLFNPEATKKLNYEYIKQTLKPYGISVSLDLINNYYYYKGYLKRYAHLIRHFKEVAKRYDRNLDFETNLKNMNDSGYRINRLTLKNFCVYSDIPYMTYKEERLEKIREVWENNTAESQWDLLCLIYEDTGIIAYHHTLNKYTKIWNLYNLL